MREKLQLTAERVRRFNWWVIKVMISQSHCLTHTLTQEIMSFSCWEMGVVQNLSVIALCSDAGPLTPSLLVLGVIQYNTTTTCGLKGYRGAGLTASSHSAVFTQRCHSCQTSPLSPPQHTQTAVWSYHEEEKPRPVSVLTIKHWPQTFGIVFLSH